MSTEKFKMLVTLSYLQEESQVYVFHLLVEVGFLPFYEHRLFELHLVPILSSCRVQDLEAVRCALVVLMYFSECVICNKVKVKVKFFPIIIDMIGRIYSKCFILK